MYTRELAIKKWLDGVANAALEFRPIVYKTNATPTPNEILMALQALSRLTRFGGFIDETIEELYAQQVKYALEHMRHRAWNEAQCQAACNAITKTLNPYLHYDPTIGNGIAYQTKCFHKTLREVDRAFENYKNAPGTPISDIQVTQKVVPCCLTPYYKHTAIRDPDAKPSFKYAPQHEQKHKDGWFVALNEDSV